MADTTPEPDGPDPDGFALDDAEPRRATDILSFDIEDDPWSYRAPRREAPATSDPRRRSLLTAVLGGIVGAALAVAAFLVLDDDPAPVDAVVERVETQIVTAEGTATPAAAVAQRVLPSIVTVEVGVMDGPDFLATGTGSGVVLDTDGTIVTNEHVVGGAAAVRAVFADGRTYDAEIVGGDALTDLAVITIDAIGLTPIEIGSSEEKSIGDTAIAVGSPLGLAGGPSVTVGVLSAFDRRVRVADDTELFGMIQTDAPITRGSSGGALVDVEGRLIGITSAIGVSDVGAEGLGFAIPVELMTRITEDIVEFGHARHAFIGITGTTHFEETADGSLAPAGVTVASILEGTAADESELQVGDVVLSFDGEALRTMNELVVLVRFYRVGDVVELEVLRGDETITIDLELLERPEGI